MEEFYKQILDVTTHSSDYTAIKKASDELVLAITRDLRKNIKIAADHGYTQSIICLYEVGAWYKDTIPIDKFIRMNDKMKEKFEEFKLEPVLDRIKKIINPFQIEVSLVENIVDPASAHENEVDVAHSVIIIYVKWGARPSPAIV